MVAGKDLKADFLVTLTSARPMCRSILPRRNFRGVRHYLDKVRRNFGLSRKAKTLSRISRPQLKASILLFSLHIFPYLVATWQIICELAQALLYV